MYLFFLITHLICAIVFIGYVFFDVCIYPFAKKTVDTKTLEIVKKAYTKGSAKVFGTAFLLLLISGAYMAKDYFGGELSWWQSNFQKLLLVKIFVLLIMCLVTFISVFNVVLLKKPDPFGKFSHLIALVLCLIMVVLAKVMWWA
ncbi:trehalose-6-phosphate synthase [Campylobacter concisus]|uniref:Trehalose-6-phosphate synthase n=1 Tax=Campylobacter concisus TaxID=199 RepID=A0A1Y5MVP8_9BACT|nr:trehalose-6-phosphate synthase [Campylobacter concisus]OUT12680.1 trehalose-6-phosphate synthase [Campylobacter concisus]